MTSLTRTAPIGGRQSQSLKPSTLGEKIVSIPQKLSWIASAHPVHTIVLISLLVSSAYVALLENSLLYGTHKGYQAEPFGNPKQLYVGPESGWKWHRGGLPEQSAALNDRAIVTLQFGQGSFDNIPSISLPEHLSVEALSPVNALTTSSRTYSFTVAKHDVSEFLDHLHELPSTSASNLDELSNGKWVIKTRPGKTRSSLAELAQDKWSEFAYLIKHAAPLDIAIMVVAYTAMHLTFGSLFVSMYRMGSRFWLATSVLLSSTFAFLLALFTTTQLGVPNDIVSLSEGLPFLVITIGFENSIKLTQAVLSHARTPSGSSVRGLGVEGLVKPPLSVIQTAIQTSIEQEGPSIVKHYLIEIAVLLAGALLSVDSTLRQFCFLSAWILFFDCLLTFSFFTAVLCIKLEIIRIQSSGKEYRPKASADVSPTTIFGQQLTRTRIRKFKLGMISAFILVNVLNVSMIPFRNVTSLPSLPSLSHRAPVRQVKDPLLASIGLDAILNEAIVKGEETVVTVLPPIRFELEVPTNSDNVAGPGDDEEHLSRYGVSSLLKSLEDPVLLKCVIAALVISVVLNGRLFAAARSGVKDPASSSNPNRELNSTPKQPRHHQQREETASPVAENNAQSLALSVPDSMRPRDDTQLILREGRAQELTDEEIVDLSLSGNLPLHALEKTLKDFTRAVKVRRSIVSRTSATSDLTHSLEASELPYQQYDWSRVFGVCCENVVGYMPIPVGLAGPLVIDGKSYFLPMATTEGVLVAGVMRGSKAINAGGGVQSVITADGMTRGPCVTFESLDRTAEAKAWLDSGVGQTVMKTAFNSTTRYGRLQTMKTAMAGTNLYIRFKASTGDAMGMNMISKGVEHALNTMRKEGFEDMDIISLSANYCSDKKPAAINWIDGRGKSVVAQATIPPEVVRSVLKTDVDSMVALNVDKNLIGSAMAGSVGGFNAHAANIVAAMYIATGQDPAQVVESANCITVMKNIRGSLQISVSMPSLEVGTIGGGTTLGPQRAMLDVLGVRGANAEFPGENARRLARIVAAGTLAAELSLCAALAAGHLVQAHMQHNRAPATQAST
ncbi:hydroxymethylglutaryl-coenzyme A reductase-domain-containing protein [Aspergillus cavernicola]|uniref:3-hydroxy-3-methylglutaryl coenzyme A reductase n=1 Tax=Aspergillus cavernicola TaxID=176166 RepID=A0ABR4IG14_9EURO